MMTAEQAAAKAAKERCYVCGSARRVVDGLCDRCRKEEKEIEHED
jgi:NMD protein affecting ribosome stability and mRNA decay